MDTGRETIENGQWIGTLGRKDRAGRGTQEHELW